MSSSCEPDPVAAMRRFLAKIAPYDPEPDHAIVSLNIRYGASGDTFSLSARAVNALTEALERYTDPDDCGVCSACGKPLNKDLYCVSCGAVEGIFGQTLAGYVAAARRSSTEGA